MDNQNETKSAQFPAAEASDPDAAFENVLQQCQQLSAYQLFRLSCAVNEMLSEAERIREVKQQLRVGDEIEYFAPSKNCCIRAVVQKCNRTHVSVQHIEDGELWRIQYASIDTGGAHLARSTASTGKLSRNDFSVGDIISFRDRDKEDRFGTIIRLNQKSATIECEFGSKWRVSYSLLSLVVNGDSQDAKPRQLSLLKDAEITDDQSESSA